MIEPSELKQLLQQAFPDGEIQVKDFTGSQDHFRAMIVSNLFQGKGLIERHRMVYSALGDAMKDQIHALTLETKTFAERQQKLL